MCAPFGPGRITPVVAITGAMLALGLAGAHAGPCTADIQKIEKTLREPNSA
jgi:hypothetical protein